MGRYNCRHRTKDDAVRIIDSIYERLKMYKGPIEQTTGKRMPAYIQ